MIVHAWSRHGSSKVLKSICSAFEFVILFLFILIHILLLVFSSRLLRSWHGTHSSSIYTTIVQHQWSWDNKGHWNIHRRVVKCIWIACEKRIKNTTNKYYYKASWEIRSIDRDMNIKHFSRLLAARFSKCVSLSGISEDKQKTRTNLCAHVHGKRKKFMQQANSF